MSITKLALPLLAVTGGIFAFGPDVAKRIIPEPVVVEKRIEVPLEQKPLERIIREASNRYRIPEMIIRAIITVESAGDPAAIRHEPHHLQRITWERNPDKRRAWASSIGLMQPMAWWVKKLLPSEDYSVLYDPEINVHIGTRILSDCVARNKTDSKRATWRRALICYNGSEAYPPKVFAALAEEVIEEGF